MDGGIFALQLKLAAFYWLPVRSVMPHIPHTYKMTTGAKHWGYTRATRGRLDGAAAAAEKHSCFRSGARGIRRRALPIPTCKLVISINENWHRARSIRYAATCLWGAYFLCSQLFYPFWPSLFLLVSVLFPQQPQPQTDWWTMICVCVNWPNVTSARLMRLSCCFRSAILSSFIKQLKLS